MELGQSTSQRGTPRGALKINAGLYQHIKTGRLITHTEDLREGPRGGLRGAWELASFDSMSGGSGIVIDGMNEFPTLRAALAYLQR